MEISFPPELMNIPYPGADCLANFYTFALLGQFDDCLENSHQN